MKYRLISFKDFTRPGGGNIRIIGILNELIKAGKTVEVHGFHEDIPGLLPEAQVHLLPTRLQQLNKRKFQLALAFLPAGLTKMLFGWVLQTFSTYFSEKNVTNSTFVFPEHLDNSLGYFLNKHRLIHGYINDIHGIAPIEFMAKKEYSFLRNLIFFFKRYAAVRLDNKVFQHAKGFLFPSPGVQKYFTSKYKLDDKIQLLVPEAANQILLEQEVDEALQEEVRSQCGLLEADTVILFAGAFKPTGGVLDLLHAFVQLKQSGAPTSKLVLIGKGSDWQAAQDIVREAGLQDAVRFLGMVPYEKLYTYQSLADIIVCPDKFSAYSDLLPHIKYYDALASGKIVINGRFTCLEAMNAGERFSLEFIPSDVASLSATLKRAVEQKTALMDKYSTNREKVKQAYTYTQSVQSMLSEFS
ncbi:MAG: glycosyltransferase [Saprospiraceae bacterium]|nr:glycosyltransferase [Saprospiraceae bacterium]